MTKKKISVQGVDITINATDESIYVSLTDIAKQSNKSEPRFLIRSWLKNANTLAYLTEWELVHNPNFNRDQMVTVRMEYAENKNVLTPSKWIKATNAIGIQSKMGRYGSGTFAHQEIALEFCSWLSPAFKVHLYKAFVHLMEQEYNRRSLEWHVSKITDNIEEIRYLLDTIPGQNQNRKRLPLSEEE